MSSTPDQFRVFKYTWGGTDHYADPLVTERAIHAESKGKIGDLYDMAYADQPAATDIHPLLAQAIAAATAATTDEDKAKAEADRVCIQKQMDEAADAARISAHEQIVAIARKVFDMPPLDRQTGHGAVEDDVNSVFFRWVDWREEKKRALENSQTSPESSASPASPPSDPSTTPTSSAST